MLQCWLKSLFSCVNLDRKPNFSDLPFPFPFNWNKMLTDNVTVNINDRMNINDYIVVTDSQ